MPTVPPDLLQPTTQTEVDKLTVEGPMGLTYADWRHLMDPAVGVAVKADETPPMALPRDCPLVLVEWQDAFGVGSDWQKIKKIRVKPFTCLSIGFWVNAPEGWEDCTPQSGYTLNALCEPVLIVPHWHRADKEIGATESGCGDIVIPHQAVQRVVNLRFGNNLYG